IRDFDVTGVQTCALPIFAWLAARMPGCRVEVVDINAARAAVAQRLGARFATPERAGGDADLVVHASGSPAGLATALALAGFEAKIGRASCSECRLKSVRA